MKTKVAGIQMSCVVDREENLSKAVRLATMAAGEGATVICFQPFFSTLWFPRSAQEANFALAEDENGPTLGRMRELARRLGVCQILPLFEKAEGRYFYTAFVVDGSGNLIGKYRKIHLPDIPLWREKYYFSDGDLGYPVFEHEGFRFGVQICWDNFFPEGARILSLSGASTIFAPTAAAFRSYHKWETVMVAWAIVNGIYLMRVNRTGHEEEHDFYGRSFCADPEGEFVIGPVGLNDGVVMTEVDSERIREVRGEWNFMRDRRQETYGPLADRS